MIPKATRWSGRTLASMPSHFRMLSSLSSQFTAPSLIANASPSSFSATPIESTNAAKPQSHSYSHQRGHGKIVALSSQQSSSSNTISTYLTELRHSSPMRLVPSRRSHLAHQFNQHHLTNENFNETHHEAALLHLSSYGGGLVPGDSLHLDIDVRGCGATVCVLTQGGQRIYRPGKHFRQYGSYYYGANTASNEQPGLDQTKSDSNTLCQSTLVCTVEPGATLFYLPDPTVPYYQSSFQERREFHCQYDCNAKNSNSSSSEHNEMRHQMGSVIAVDWYSAGRRLSTGMEEERWAFDYLATRTELFVTEQPNQGKNQTHATNRPVLIEAMTFDNRRHSKSTPSAHKADDSSGPTPAAISMGHTHDAMATVLLHGPTSLPVAKRVKMVARHLASLRTRVRWDYSEDDDDSFPDFDKGSSGNNDQRFGKDEDLGKLLEALGGRVILSVTPVANNDHINHNENTTHHDQEPITHMVRILAESNEDIYRILHYCLKEKQCSRLLGGFEPYKDRIHSSKTVRPQTAVPMPQSQEKPLRMNKMKTRENNKLDFQLIANQLVHGNNQDTHDNGVCNTENHGAWFRMCTLSDSSLPVGSFAHSLGVESASQLGLFDDLEAVYEDDNKYKSWSMNDSSSSCSIEALSNYIYAVSRSNARFSTPLILSGYSLLSPFLQQSSTNALSENTNELLLDQLDIGHIYREWLEIDNYVDALLVSNGPGRRASMDQGLGLLRISSSFVDQHHYRNLTSLDGKVALAKLWELLRKSIEIQRGTTSSEEYFQSTDFLQNSQMNMSLNPTYNSLKGHGHAAPIYGIFSASLGIPPLDASRIYSFGAARDAISAAVRLNLIGPMAGLTILDSVGRVAVEEGLEEGLLGMLSDVGEEKEIGTKMKHWLHSVGTCAPIMDSVQPCHDLLSVRLFRT